MTLGDFCHYKWDKEKKKLKIKAKINPVEKADPSSKKESEVINN